MRWNKFLEHWSKKFYLKRKCVEYTSYHFIEKILIYSSEIFVTIILQITQNSVNETMLFHNYSPHVSANLDTTFVSQ